MNHSAGGQSSRSAPPSVDPRGRIRVEECYAIVYCDHNEKLAAGVPKWKEGQLTYHKTDRKVLLFGPKNKRLEELFNTTLQPPPPTEGEEVPQKTIGKDLQSMLEKKPTLAVGQTMFLKKQRYELRIERVKFVHHKAYKVASRTDRDGDIIRDKVRKLLDEAPDILAGVLPPKRPANDRACSTSPPPHQRRK